MGSLPRLDEALEALEWVLAHEPEYYPAVPRTRLRLAKIMVPGGLRIAVYYTVDVDDGCCTLHLLLPQP